MSSIREWLNDSFFNTAFSLEEQKRIIGSQVVSGSNCDNDGISADKQSDKVFLLSIEEVKKYFNSDSDRQCFPTAFAKLQCNDSWWWLRSPGVIPNSAASVLKDGKIYPYGNFVNSDNGGVRPALWIDIDP